VLVVLTTALVIAAPYSGMVAAGAQDFIADFGPVVLGLIATLAALRVARRPGTDPALRRAWRRLAIAFGCWWAGDLIWFVYAIRPQDLRGSRDCLVAVCVS
jgi:hypothetical protein